jgi:hypothetical protein
MDDRGERALAPIRYAVAFQAADQLPAAGALTITDEAIVLSGRCRGEPVEIRIPSGELASVRIARRSQDRLNGYATVALGCLSGEVRIAPFGIAMLHELADLLASLSEQQAVRGERVDVVVPLTRGSGQRVRELVLAGPPFDPGSHGLRRHDVFLGDQDVVFVFEGPQVRQSLERTLAEPSLWRAGLAWRGCIAGRPRFADPAVNSADGRELIYSWRN